MPYLANLLLHLTDAAARLPESIRARHAEYVLAAQNDDGGFAGRRGPSDPYYTAFALRTLTIAGQLDADCAARAATFLRQRLEKPDTLVDFLASVEAAMLVGMAAGVDLFAQWGRDVRQSVAEFVDPLRRPDGGYAKTQRGGQGSTYATFLVAACRDSIGLPLEEPDRLREFAHSRRRDDGGFVEIGPMRRSGTNPTAAAVGLLKMLDALDSSIRDGAARFLATMQGPEGGFLANRRIPLADLLSTFTALVGLRDRNCSVSQLALKLGFSSRSHFSRIFRQHTGLTPTAYRRLF